MSLCSKRLCQLVTPVLFEELDLSNRDGAELDDMYNHLFGCHATGRLKEVRFDSVSCQFLEEMCEQSDLLGAEFVERANAIGRLLGAIHSAHTLRLTVCLSSEVDADAFHEDFLSAVKQTVSIITSKVVCVEIYGDHFSFSDGLEGLDSMLSPLAKIREVIRVLPADIVSGVYLTGFDTQDSHSEGPDISELKNVQTLSLKDCPGSFAEWNSQSLTNLSVTWGARNDGEDIAFCSMRLAVRLITMSAESICSLTLNNLGGRTFHSMIAGRTSNLPRLIKLQITDESAGPGSCLATLCDAFTMNNLHSLYFETNNIFETDLDTCWAHLPKLQFLSLAESSLVQPRKLGAAAPFDSITETCKKREITLRTALSCLRCDSAAELQAHLARVTYLSDTLAAVSLATGSLALQGLRCVNSEVLRCLTRLSICITDASQALDNSTADEIAPSLLHLLEFYRAPNLEHLGVTVFTKHGDQAARDITAVLRSQAYPNLHALDGAIIAAGPASPDEYHQIEQSMRTVTDSLGLDSQTMRFITRSQLGAAEDHTSFTDEEEESEDSTESEEASDDGMMGHADDEDHLVCGRSFGEEVSGLDPNAATQDEEDGNNVDLSGDDWSADELYAADVTPRRAHFARTPTFAHTSRASSRRPLELLKRRESTDDSADSWSTDHSDLDDE